jgi:hypothetical protein
LASRFFKTVIKENAKIQEKGNLMLISNPWKRCERIHETKVIDSFLKFYYCNVCAKVFDL